VTCPAGVTRPVARSGRVTFGAACHGCPLRDWCTTSADGRSLKLTEYDAALRAACAAWSSGPRFRQDYPAPAPRRAGHRPGRHLAGRQLKLRYRGVAKNHAWLKRRTAALNLRNLASKGPDLRKTGWSGVTSPRQDAVDDADGAFGHGLADVRLAFGQFAVVAVLRPGKPQPSAGLGVTLGLACDGRCPSVPDAHEPGLGQSVKHVPDGARFQSLELG
jgi:hypothetical protein